MASMVVIPTYNEAENLVPLVEQIMALPGFQVLVADDNSPDGTGSLADELSARFARRVEVLHRPAKLGLGAAYVDAFRLALEWKHPYLFQMDADFSHDPADLPRLLAALEQGADLAIGSRYVDAGGTRHWPLWRRAISQGGSLYARLVLGLPLRDLTGGFRGWRRQALLRLGLDSVRSEGYAFQVEMAYRCVRTGGRAVEIPIVFAERQKGRSKMSAAIIAEAVVRVCRLRLDGVRLPRTVREVLIGR